MPLRKTHCIKRISHVYDIGIGSPFHPSHNSFLGRKHVTGFLGLSKKCPELRSISVLFILIDGGLFLCKAIYSSSGLILGPEGCYIVCLVKTAAAFVLVFRKQITLMIRAS